MIDGSSGTRTLFLITNAVFITQLCFNNYCTCFAHSDNFCTKKYVRAPTDSQNTFTLQKMAFFNQLKKCHVEMNQNDICDIMQNLNLCEVQGLAPLPLKAKKYVEHLQIHKLHSYYKNSNFDQLKSVTLK